MPDLPPKESRLAALEASLRGPAGDAGDPPASGTTAPDGDGKPKEAPKGAKTEDEVFRFKDGDDEIEMTPAEHQRLVRLGLRVGSEEVLADLEALNEVVAANPGLENVLRTLAKDPATRKKLIAEYGKAEGKGDGGNEDPKDKKIRELQAELAQAQGAKGGDPAKQFEERVVELSANYPSVKRALAGEIPGVSRKLILGALAASCGQGATIHQALASVAKELGGSHDPAKAKAKQRLGGAGGGGGGVTTVTPAAATGTARDLTSGAARRRALEMLRPR